MAIVIQAVYRVGRRALTQPVLVALAVASFLALAAFAVPFPVVILGAGAIGWLLRNLFSSWVNILLTLGSVYLVWLVVPPLVRFLVIDAVWEGAGRDDCLAEKVGREVGACWPFIQKKFYQLVYGFYPSDIYWRPNLTFALGAALLIPLLVPKAPYKALNAVLCTHELLVATPAVNRGFNLKAPEARSVRQGFGAAFAEPHVVKTSRQIMQEMQIETLARGGNAVREDLKPGQVKWFVATMGLPGQERVLSVAREERYAGPNDSP